MIQLYKVLGYFGALPFLIAALGSLAFGGVDDGTLGKLALAFQLMYSGLILAFLSGVHWSHAFPRSSEGQMLTAMLPVVLSTVVISVSFFVIFGGVFGAVLTRIICTVFLLLNIMAFYLVYIFDIQYLIRDKFPVDYMSTRLKITFIVTGCLFTTMVAIWL